MGGGLAKPYEQRFIGSSARRLGIDHAKDLGDLGSDELEQTGVDPAAFGGLDRLDDVEGGGGLEACTDAPGGLVHDTPKSGKLEWNVDEKGAVVFQDVLCGAGGTQHASPCSFAVRKFTPQHREVDALSVLEGECVIDGRDRLLEFGATLDGFPQKHRAAG